MVTSLLEEETAVCYSSGAAVSHCGSRSVTQDALRTQYSGPSSDSLTQAAWEHGDSEMVTKMARKATEYFFPLIGDQGSRAGGLGWSGCGCRGCIWLDLTRGSARSQGA